MEKLKRGKELFEQQQFNEAITVLSDFLNQAPNNADALYTRAISYRKLEKYEASIVDFNTILIRLPDEPTLLCERGISHFKNNNIEASMLDMDRAVELEPNNPYRYSSRAYIRAKTDLDGAILDYEKAIELDPKDEISLNNLGLLQENAGKMKAAKKSFNKANEILGYDPENRIEKKGISEEKITQENLDKNNSSLGKVMLSVFTSKQIRKEYFMFLKSYFQKKT